MANDDDTLLGLILGGLVGAAIAAPKLEDKQDLEEYRRLKQEITSRQQKVGNLPDITKIIGSPYNKPFMESYKMYLYGFFRGSVILSVALIESLLRDKYGDKNFNELIEVAKANGFIEQLDYHFLQAIRTQRNISAHEILREVTEEDAVIVERIVNKLLHKLL